MEPFVKWAGGKRQLLDEIKKRMPSNYNKYIEPFVGGGALFFSLDRYSHNPKRINDTNHQLINCYEQIKKNPNELMSLLDIHSNNHNQLSKSEGSADEYYYKIRTEYNERIHEINLNIQDAANFIYLNKSCYNGLYRVNSNGFFNSPSGKKRKVNLYSKENICECSRSLKKTVIKIGDFENICKYLRAGDFVFFDSPYHDTFDNYQKGGFSEKDHKRLAKLFRSLSRRGVYCMLTNNDTEFIRSLYPLEECNIDTVNVKRMINCDAENREGFEVIITSKNY